jgi:hypothetical protein
MYSNNAFVDWAAGLVRTRAKLRMCPRRRSSCHVCDCRRKVFVTTKAEFVFSTDAKFVTTVTKFVQDLIVFNYIQYSDFDASLNFELRNTV